jgi:hypothetical protein
VDIAISHPAPAFIAALLVGMLGAVVLDRWLWRPSLGDGAMIERAVFPAEEQHVKWLLMSLRRLIPPMPTFSGWGTAARRFAYRRLKIAEFRMAIAAIGD